MEPSRRVTRAAARQAANAAARAPAPRRRRPHEASVWQNPGEQVLTAIFDALLAQEEGAGLVRRRSGGARGAARRARPRAPRVPPTRSHPPARSTPSRLSPLSLCLLLPQP